MGRVTEIREPSDTELSETADLEEETDVPAKAKGGKAKGGKVASAAETPEKLADSDAAAAAAIGGEVARSEVRVVTISAAGAHEVKNERWKNPTDHEIRLALHPHTYIMPPGTTVDLPASYRRSIREAAPQLVLAAES